MAGEAIAELILEAVRTMLTGLTITEGRVFRARSRPLDETEVPGLLIYMGPDRQVDDDDRNAVTMKSVLEVQVEARIKDVGDDLDTQLNAIRVEVEQALLPPFPTSPAAQLGIPQVEGIDFIQAGPPGHDEETDKPTGALPIVFHIQYERRYDDPTQ